MTEQPTLGTADIGEIVARSAQEIKLNLQVVSDINKDLREHYYAKRETMSPDDKRRIGTYLKGGMDVQIKGLIDLLLGFKRRMEGKPLADVRKELPITEVDQAISELGPYGRERLRSAIAVGDGK